VVNQSGGHVAVDSRPGAGTTFRIYLPRVEGIPAPAAPAPEATPRHRAGETVLLVEDEDAVRRLARLTLESHGFTVLDAHSPGDALLLAEQHPGTIDLLVTDVIMPGMSGRELAERLLRSRPGLKVLYMSGYSDDILDERGALGPGMAFLPKPFSPAALARKTVETLQR
jgi:CheY-like chemotaxis protein